MRGFAPRRATGPSPSSRARLAVVLLVACAAQILSVLLVGYPPIQDYPNHLLRRHVIEHHSQVSVYAEHLGIDKRFRPNMLMDLYLALLAQLLPLQLAGKALICTFIFLGYSAVWFYLRRFGEDLLGALIACHLAGSWIFLKGLLNFNAGISFGLIYLAVLWPVRNRFHWRRAALAYLMSFAMVCAHGFAFLSFTAIAGLALLIEERGLTRAVFVRMSSAIPGTIAFISFILGIVDSSSLGSEKLTYVGGLRGLLFGKALVVWMRFDPVMDKMIGVGCWSLIVLGIVFAALQPATSETKRRLKTAILFTLLAALLYLVLPDRLSSGSWGHMKFRMAHIIVLLSLPLLSAIPWPSGRRLGFIVLVSAWAAGFVASVHASREFNRDVDSFMELGDELPKGSFVLTFDLSDPAAVRPYLHTWSYICIERDCLSPQIFATPYIQNIYFKTAVHMPRQGDWSSLAGALRHGYYDAVIVRGRSQHRERELLKTMRLAKETSSGTLFLRIEPAHQAVRSSRGSSNQM